MPAQLVVLSQSAAEKPAGPSKKAAEKKKGGVKKEPGRRKDKDSDPGDIPVPVIFTVVGQKAFTVGHFANLSTLLDKVHARKRLPGGSNTMFASVAKLEDLKSPAVHDKLERLPEQLTIIVHEGKPRG